SGPELNRSEDRAFAMGGGYGGMAYCEPTERGSIRDCGNIVDRRDGDAGRGNLRVWRALVGARIPDPADGLGGAADGVLASVPRNVRVVRERVPADLPGADVPGARPGRAARRRRPHARFDRPRADLLL